MTRLTLLTRDGCRLCGEMKAVVRQLAPSHRLALVEIDVSTSPELERRWGAEIPVLLHGEQVVARHRTTARALAAAVARVTSP